ncbi:MAG: hypothetical protein ACK559_06800, partial [bacterium]
RHRLVELPERLVALLPLLLVREVPREIGQDPLGPDDPEEPGEGRGPEAELAEMLAQDARFPNLCKPVGVNAQPRHRRIKRRTRCRVEPGHRVERMGSVIQPARGIPASHRRSGREQGRGQSRQRRPHGASEVRRLRGLIYTPLPAVDPV